MLYLQATNSNILPSLQLTDTVHPEIPAGGYYDTGEGFFYAKDSSIYDYKLQSRIRRVGKKEADWIKASCRRGFTANENPNEVMTLFNENPNEVMLTFNEDNPNDNEVMQLILICSLFFSSSSSKVNPNEVFILLQSFFFVALVMPSSRKFCGKKLCNLR